MWWCFCGVLSHFEHWVGLGTILMVRQPPSLSNHKIYVFYGSSSLLSPHSHAVLITDAMHQHSTTILLALVLSSLLYKIKSQRKAKTRCDISYICSLYQYPPMGMKFCDFWLHLFRLRHDFSSSNLVWTEHQQHRNITHDIVEFKFENE